MHYLHVIFLIFIEPFKWKLILQLQCNYCILQVHSSYECLKSLCKLGQTKKYLCFRLPDSS